MSSLPTPDTGHLSKPPYRDAVYEPAEDTFLMLDALEADAPMLKARQPRLCLEIGAGSGCAITFLSSLLGPGNTECMATDINRLGLLATVETGRRASTTIETVHSDLFAGIRLADRGIVDILLFNPPYVPTEAEEMGSHGIEASWAGGKDGREVLDRLLPSIAGLIGEEGLFYLVTVEENNPLDIARILAEDGLFGEVVARRQSGPERLCIWRYHKGKGPLA